MPKPRCDANLRWLGLVLAALIAVLITLLGAGTSSAATVHAAQTRVGAHTLVAQVAVGPGGGIGAGQQLGNDLPAYDFALATGVAAKSVPRLAQDVAVSSAAPKALDTARSIGRASHNRALQRDIAALPRGASGVRVNQQQVNALGQRVGINRPDLQYTLNDVRHYVEYEGLGNPRGAAHEVRTLANDPLGAFRLVMEP